ncbi:hypothetical protein IGB42_01608 [Andreprevotia sp. IGB-42]|uniref:hypothetical protein n=1 Tax=Andreprevotia sp. IGB-42 TaxID=2497473 RepID=UPI0013596C1C|nr:hypothetical protein [Andreprevotia sp. IGB-42]KAF0813929.1 hypothetical protein IGB42_01608 [Andreprevotia sp. IGB-42]
MGDINISRSEYEALKAIDSVVLSRVIDQCVDEEYSSALLAFRLNNCGPFVASKLRMFENSLSEYRRFKAPKRRSEARADALRAGADLHYAVQQMKMRGEMEERQAEFFYIDDHVQPPVSFTDHLTVRVHYRWRISPENEWVYGSIEFSHKSDPLSDFQHTQPVRKKSAAHQAKDRQDELYAEWEALKRQALWSVRDYFQGGGDGASIPKVFRVKIDVRTRRLNNFSARFWVG